jgi:shikimate kinase
LLETSTQNIKERLKDLLKERTPIYEQVADYIVEVDEKTPVQVAREIVDLCKE